ncbi:hypothetical protein GQ457_07G031060 [Hibiscus cannabinus]
MSRSPQLHLSANISEKEFHRRGNFKDAASATSGSNVTSASNSDEMFQQQDFRQDSRSSLMPMKYTAALFLWEVILSGEMVEAAAEHTDEDDSAGNGSRNRQDSKCFQGEDLHLMQMKNGSEFLLTDTVGFIQKLPTTLVAVFRSTLEEIFESSLLVHVGDICHPLAEQQIDAVEKVLAELDVSGTRLIGLVIHKNSRILQCCAGKTEVSNVRFEWWRKLNIPRMGHLSRHLRRQYRAKFEAQNKLIRIPKPYLHESRHLHALKRARGSGGQFLNTKKLQQSKSILTNPGPGMSRLSNPLKGLFSRRRHQTHLEPRDFTSCLRRAVNPLSSKSTNPLPVSLINLCPGQEAMTLSSGHKVKQFQVFGFSAETSFLSIEPITLYFVVSRQSHVLLEIPLDVVVFSRGGFASDAGTQDYVYPPTQVDYSKSISLIPLHYAEPYFDGVATTAYGSQAMSQQIHHAHMMAMLPTRVPLPLDLKEDEPIYVNAKQYHAILRSPQLHLSANISEKEFHRRGNFKDAASATSGSDVTSASNSDKMFQQQDFRVVFPPSSSDQHLEPRDFTLSLAPVNPLSLKSTNPLPVSLINLCPGQEAMTLSSGHKVKQFQVFGFSAETSFLSIEPITLYFVVSRQSHVLLEIPLDVVVFSRGGFASDACINDCFNFRTFFSKKRLVILIEMESCSGPCSGGNGIHGKLVGGHAKLVSLTGTPDYVYPPPPPTQIDYSKSISLIPLHYAEPYFDGVATTAYGSQAMSLQIYHAHMIAMLLLEFRCRWI